jgi:hypothetical protein
MTGFESILMSEECAIRQRNNSNSCLQKAVSELLQDVLSDLTLKPRWLFSRCDRQTTRQIICLYDSDFARQQTMKPSLARRTSFFTLFGISELLKILH